MNEVVSVIHLGLGPIGQAIGRAVAEEGRLRSAAAVDIAPTIIGHTLSEVCDAPLPPVQVVEALADARVPPGAVVLQATASKLTAVHDQLRAAIEQGYHVVSTCEEMVWPWNDHQALAAEIDRAARAAGVTLLGVGVNPGFAMDTLPVLLSRAATEVEAVHVVRTVDVLERRLPLQRKMGLGQDPDQVQRQLNENRIGHVGLRASVQMLAAGLGWSLEVVDVQSRPIVATVPVESGLGTVLPGRCIGIWQQATGIINGLPRITLTLNMEAGAEGGSRDEILIDGDQSLRMHLKGLHGDRATAALVINQALRIQAMPSGLQTMLSAPLLASHP